MFKAEMVASCGLDCDICSQALADENPCQGCNGPDDRKPEFCARHCAVIISVHDARCPRCGALASC